MLAELESEKEGLAQRSLARQEAASKRREQASAPRVGGSGREGGEEGAEDKEELEGKSAAGSARCFVCGCLYPGYMFLLVLPPSTMCKQRPVPGVAAVVGIIMNACDLVLCAAGEYDAEDAPRGDGEAAARGDKAEEEEAAESDEAGQ